MPREENSYGAVNGTDAGRSAMPEEGHHYKKSTKPLYEIDFSDDLSPDEIEFRKRMYFIYLQMHKKTMEIADPSRQHVQNRIKDMREDIRQTISPDEDNGGRTPKYLGGIKLPQSILLKVAAYAIGDVLELISNLQNAEDELQKIQADPDKYGEERINEMLDIAREEMDSMEKDSPEWDKWKNCMGKISQNATTLAKYIAGQEMQRLNDLLQNDGKKLTAVALFRPLLLDAIEKVYSKSPVSDSLEKGSVSEAQAEKEKQTQLSSGKDGHAPGKPGSGREKKSEEMRRLFTLADELNSDVNRENGRQPHREAPEAELSRRVNLGQMLPKH